MIVVDTNILVRYLTNDDPEQSLQEKELLKNSKTILVTKTVLLECEWVLRSAYKLPRESILNCLMTVCGLPNVIVENAKHILTAIEYYQ